MKAQHKRVAERFKVWMPPLRVVAVPPLRVMEEWQFPLGPHDATLKIVGRGRVEPEDMDALMDLVIMFRAAILRRQSLPEPEYSI